MNNWQKYMWIALVSVRSNLAYFGDVSSRVLFLGVILYIFMRLWQVTYAQIGSSSLGGLSLAQMLWYLTVTESIMMSVPRVSQLVDEDIRTGSLSVQLLRPVSYPLYRLWVVLGERVVRFSMNMAVGSMITLFLVGPIHMSPLGLAIFLLGLPLAFVLDFLGNFLIGLGAFWLEDTSGLLLLYSRITMIVGGMLIPLDLLPEGIKEIVKNLPFASMVYGPARLLVEPSLVCLGELLLRQSVAIAAMTLAVAFVYSHALKRVFVNGG